MCHFVHGREYESPFLRGNYVEVAMGEDADPAASGGSSPFHEKHLRRLPATDSTCATTSIVVMKPEAPNTTIKELLSCDTADGKHYFVRGVTDYFIWANKKGIIDRTVELSMPEGAYLDEDTATLEMPSPGRLKFKEKNAKDGLPLASSRSPRAVTGIRSALVVKVIASGVATEFSEARLSNSVFGNGADGNVDPVTMKSHFQTCSNGQLNFLPAIDRDGTSIRIRNGKTNISLLSAIFFCITRFLTALTRCPPLASLPQPHTHTPSGATTVTVSAAATQGNDGEINNAVIDELNSQFGVANPNLLADHLMFFLPPGVMSGAYAWTGGDTSVYQSGWYVHLSLTRLDHFSCASIVVCLDFIHILFGMYPCSTIHLIQGRCQCTNA